MQLAPEGSRFDPYKNRFKERNSQRLMEYESDRALVETKIDEVKRVALLEASQSTFVVPEQDPKWARPAPQSTLPSVGVEEAQGFWINGGKTGGKKDEPHANSEPWQCDLTNPEEGEFKGFQDGIKWGSIHGKMTAADTDKLIKARNGPTDEDLANMLNVSLLDFYKGMNNIYNREGLIKAYNGFHSG